MKKTITTAILFLIVFASCRKDDAGGYTSTTAHMTAQIDGVGFSFNTYTKAVWQDTVIQNVPVRLLGIIGQNATDEMDVIVGQISTRPGVGTYTESGTTYAIQMDYYPNANTSSFAYTNHSQLNTASTNKLQVVLSSIDTIGVRGSFQGEVYYYSTTATTPDITKKRVITGGDFYAKF